MLLGCCHGVAACWLGHRCLVADGRLLATLNSCPLTASTLGLGRQASHTLQAACTLLDKFPTRRRLLTRACFFIGDVCFGFANATGGISAGMASSLSVSPQEQRISVIAPLAGVLSLPEEDSTSSQPTAEHEVHEAAATALGDAVVGADGVREAVMHGALESIGKIMLRYADSQNLQVAGCRALHTLWMATAENAATRELFAASAKVPLKAMAAALCSAELLERIGQSREGLYRTAVQAISAEAAKAPNRRMSL